jgi:hypothetical protein
VQYVLRISVLDFNHPLIILRKAQIVLPILINIFHILHYFICPEPKNIAHKFVLNITNRSSVIIREYVADQYKISYSFIYIYAPIPQCDRIRLLVCFFAYCISCSTEQICTKFDIDLQ